MNNFLEIFVINSFENPSKALLLINLSIFGIDFSKITFTLSDSFKIVYVELEF